MDAKEAEKHLATIRHIMESATQITVLPGWAAILGGALALAGCGVTYVLMKSLDFGSIPSLEASRRTSLIALWIGVAVVATGIDIVMTLRLARKKGKNAWSRLSQLAAYAMGPAIGAAFAISLALALQGQWGMIPAVWMILYGLGVWMAGVLSVHAPGVLGLVFMVCGVATLFWTRPLSLAMVALTFGIAHVVFGIYLLVRFGD
jgi:hypothetical protein